MMQINIELIPVIWEQIAKHQASFSQSKIDMSHFTTIKVQIKNGEILYQTLQELGYKVEYNKKVRGYAGNKTDAEYVIRQDNGYDLGFRLNGEMYEIVADFWGARIDQKALVNSIMQKYAHKTLMASVQEQGFNVEEKLDSCH